MGKLLGWAGLLLACVACGGAVSRSEVIPESDARAPDASVDAGKDAAIAPGLFRICGGPCVTSGAECGDDPSDPGTLVQCGDDSPDAWIALPGTRCAAQAGGAYCCAKVTCPDEVK